MATVAAAPSHAQKRVALVMGNSDYTHVTRLPNPANDAESLGELLKRAGFQSVDVRVNMGIVDTRRAVRDFADRAYDADVALVFYAGHGIEVDGVNYLIPIDAQLDRDIDVEDETVSLDRVLKVIEPAKRLRLVILDACRDNPFTPAMKRTIASRAVGHGLAKVEPVTSDTMIAFAAKAGSTASDGKGDHSPFTSALLRHIATPDLDVRLAFGRVRDDVLQATGGHQEPFVYGSLGGSTIALVSVTPAVSPTPPARSDPDQPVRAPASGDGDAERDYDLARKVGTTDAWDVFLARHLSGFYSDLARTQRSRLAAARVDERDAVRNRVASLVAQMQTQWSQPNATAMGHLDEWYADKVSFYGETKTRQAILEEKAKFIERWPERNYHVRPGSFNVDCDQGLMTCKAEVIIDWRVASAARHATNSGASNISYVFSLRGGTVSITAENGSVIARDLKR
jgi:hypothetical protein